MALFYHFLLTPILTDARDQTASQVLVNNTIDSRGGAYGIAVRGGWEDVRCTVNSGPVSPSLFTRHAAKSMWDTQQAMALSFLLTRRMQSPIANRIVR